MLILGLNCFHGDSSAALLRDGELIAAAEEERFRRLKHWAGFPAQAIDFCLRHAGATLEQIDHVALNQNGWANLPGKLAYLIAARPSPALILDRLRTRWTRRGVAELLAQAYAHARFRAQVHHIEHHFSHLSSAFHVSPFAEAAALSLDGFGDFSSAAWGLGRGARIDVRGRVNFPHSLGIFYQAITQYLGFPDYGDEYKVMGLAAYGAPDFADAMGRVVRLHDDGSFALDLGYFRHHREATGFQWNDGAPRFAELFSPALEKLLGPRRHPADPIDDRHRAIAHSAQAMYERASFNLLNRLHAQTRTPNLVLAGGCAMNSVANGKIRRMTPFEQLYVHPAAGDAGGAVGAAFTVWHRLGGERGFVMDHAYWGPQYERADIDRLLAARAADLAKACCAVEPMADEAALCRRAAGFIADGQVLGWFQGRMEWGPRALGNRSILCDPRRADMKQILNVKIKRRESFRPFAPSILEEAVADWFEDAAPVPFMMQVLPIRADKRGQIPAVTHVDGSGRLQTVSARTNARYHRLVEAFRDLTGVPMVLNTSFNENEPVVRTPDEALDCFMRTKMDGLVLGDVFITRRADAAV